MTTVKIESFKENNEPTASEKILRKSRETFSIKDELGRVLKVRAPSYLEKTDFIAALGERGALEGYITQVSPAMYVREIDGDPVTFPTRLSEVRALLQRLDEEGVTAVIKCVVENIMTNDGEKEAKDRLKK